MNFNFGDEVKDVVTEFQGVVTARAEYATGCNQVLVQPPLESPSKWSGPQWFDVERIELVKAGAVAINSSPTGGPRGAEAAPVR